MKISLPMVLLIIATGVLSACTSYGTLSSFSYGEGGGHSDALLAKPGQVTTRVIDLSGLTPGQSSHLAQQLAQYPVARAVLEMGARIDPQQMDIFIDALNYGDADLDIAPHAEADKATLTLVLPGIVSQLPQRCLQPVSSASRWWSAYTFHPHFGCATHHNDLLQTIPVETKPLPGSDPVMGVSAVSRYRKGEVMPLREQKVQVGSQN